MVFKKKKKKEENPGDPDYKELYMRVSADFQNYKRRVGQERAEWIQDAQADVIKPLLAVMDDLDRAIESCKKQEGSDATQGILEGLELTRKNVVKIFTDLGVQEIDCSGEFDPDSHEALLHVDAPDHESGHIVEVISKGYTFHGKILRHAKISVAK